MWVHCREWLLPRGCKFGVPNCQLEIASLETEIGFSEFSKVRVNILGATITRYGINESQTLVSNTIAKIYVDSHKNR
jgi:hypothetical protein